MSTAVERVQEYLRQRRALSRDLGMGIHCAWSDPGTPAATLTVQDVEWLLARVLAQPKDTA